METRSNCVYSLYARLEIFRLAEFIPSSHLRGMFRFHDRLSSRFSLVACLHRPLCRTASHDCHVNPLQFSIWLPKYVYRVLLLSDRMQSHSLRQLLFSESNCFIGKKSRSNWVNRALTLETCRQRVKEMEIVKWSLRTEQYLVLSLDIAVGED